ncbi:2-hydroxyacid dehydrogenase [Enhygromyxa salina]|uniref:Glyoxylate/hydroxypyruvate reductase B n=1 Tax=Enhygromyxa salina TaxID=215803 RepID=A0A2S9Y4C8_9BACT|nr:D-glycerate dehydrogenase [Enhygromyxa salina]PRP99959.1 Glyoxylate/hydroxypyruvate reductase B [Enhygromyxa salina]
MTHLVVVPPEVPREWLARLDQPEAGCEVIVGIDAVPTPRLPEVVGLLSLLTMPVDLELLVRLPALRVVSNMAVGYDNVVIPACAARGVALGNTPGVLTDATADLTMALLLAAARRIDEAALDAREGRWHTWTPDGWLGVELRGTTLGVVGLGKIGYAVAERARGFGMQICYVGRSDHDHPDAAKLGAQRLSFTELLARADIVTLHVPLTDETQGMIDAAALEQMKPEAILINTSRGAIVDQDALLAALTTGRLRGAALDVTSPEPLPPAHPLFAAPGCLILPHIGSATHTTRRRMAELACLNLLAGVRGEPLPHPVALTQP